MKGECSPFGLVHDLLIRKLRFDALAFSASKGKRDLAVIIGDRCTGKMVYRNYLLHIALDFKGFTISSMPPDTRIHYIHHGFLQSQ